MVWLTSIVVTFKSTHISNSSRFQFNLVSLNVN